MFYSQLE
jgi:hypothetical protein